MVFQLVEEALALGDNVDLGGLLLLIGNELAREEISDSARKDKVLDEIVLVAHRSV